MSAMSYNTSRHHSLPCAPLPTTCLPCHTIQVGNTPYHMSAMSHNTSRNHSLPRVCHVTQHPTNLICISSILTLNHQWKFLIANHRILAKQHLPAQNSSFLMECTPGSIKHDLVTWPCHLPSNFFLLHSLPHFLGKVCHWEHNGWRGKNGAEQRQVEGDI